jgi:hypothetical protein
MESGDDKQLEQELVDVLGCWTFDFKPSMALIEKSENDVVEEAMVNSLKELVKNEPFSTSIYTKK